MTDKMRSEFEEWYATNAFDYAANPIGSRECGLQWTAWQAARTVPEWISVTDRLPEQDVSFLAVTDCGGDIYISTMRLPVLISKNSKPDGDFIRERVTHWMPLPAAPEGKK